MFGELNGQLMKVVALAESCPERYKASCFEILWTAVVQQSYSQPENNQNSIGTLTGTAGPSDSISSNGIDANVWQKAFHFQEDSWVIIVRNLKETTKAKKQVKLALLSGIADKHSGGRGLIARTTLVDYCKNHAAYDSANFSATMKRQKDLFIDADGGWMLTIPGEERALEVIEELTQ